MSLQQLPLPLRGPHGDRAVWAPYGGAPPSLLLPFRMRAWSQRGWPPRVVGRVSEMHVLGPRVEGPGGHGVRGGPRRFCWVDSLQSASLFPARFPFPKGSTTVFSSFIEKGTCMFALGHWARAWRRGWGTVLPSFWPLPGRRMYAQWTGRPWLGYRCTPCLRGRS